MCSFLIELVLRTGRNIYNLAVEQYNSFPISNNIGRRIRIKVGNVRIVVLQQEGTF